jgi:hypothetical protein
MMERSEAVKEGLRVFYAGGRNLWGCETSYLNEFRSFCISFGGGSEGGGDWGSLKLGLYAAPISIL